MIVKRKSNGDHESSFWIIFIYFLAEESRLGIIFCSDDDYFEANVNRHLRDASDICTSVVLFLRVNRVDARWHCTERGLHRNDLVAAGAPHHVSEQTQEFLPIDSGREKVEWKCRCVR